MANTARNWALSLVRTAFALITALKPLPFGNRIEICVQTTTSQLAATAAGVSGAEAEAGAEDFAAADGDEAAADAATTERATNATEANKRNC